MTKILPLDGNDHFLARAILRGEKAAMTTFYDTYSGKMLAICRRYLPDAMQAEDVMIESLMKVIQKIDQFGFKGSFEGWVKRIVVNEALMKLRSQKNVEIDIDEVNPINFTEPEFSDLEAEELLEMIHELPDGYRTVFNLYALEGYNHKEIAERLGISEGTSKSQLSRARSLLQKMIEERNYYYKDKRNER